MSLSTDVRSTLDVKITIEAGSTLGVRILITVIYGRCYLQITIDLIYDQNYLLLMSSTIDVNLRSTSPCQQFPPRPEVLCRLGAEGSDNLQTNVFQMVVV